MTWRRFKLQGTWQAPPAHKPASRDEQSGYDFHSHSLAPMDIMWAWAFAAGVLLLTLFF